MTFQELLAKRPKSKTESLLCQAIAALSTQPQFASMTPWEVYEHVERTAQHWDYEEVQLERERNAYQDELSYHPCVHDGYYDGDLCRTHRQHIYECEEQGLPKAREEPI